MDFAHRLAEQRAKAGWSQADIAEMLHVSRQSVSQWENGNASPELDRIIELSRLFSVTTDYLLGTTNEEHKENESSVSNNSENTATYVSREEATDFIDTREAAARKIALGIALCVFSPATLIVMSSLAENGIGLSKSAAQGIGLTALFVCIAIATTLFTVSSMLLKKFAYLEKDAIDLDSPTRTEIVQREEEFSSRHIPMRITGIIACIISPLPVILTTSFTNTHYLIDASASVIFALISCGLYLIFRVELAHNAYTVLLEKEEYTRIEKAIKKEKAQKMLAVSGIYWLSITLIFFIWSFAWNAWETSWTIWPIAGIAYALVMSIYGTILARHKQKETPCTSVYLSPSTTHHHATSQTTTHTQFPHFET